MPEFDMCIRCENNADLTTLISQRDHIDMIDAVHAGQYHKME